MPDPFSAPEPRPEPRPERSTMSKRHRLYVVWLAVGVAKEICSKPTHAERSMLTDELRNAYYALGGHYQERSDPAMRRDIREFAQEVTHGW